MANQMLVASAFKNVRQGLFKDEKSHSYND